MIRSAAVSLLLLAAACESTIPVSISVAGDWRGLQPDERFEWSLRLFESDDGSLEGCAEARGGAAVGSFHYSVGGSRAGAELELTLTPVTFGGGAASTAAATLVHNDTLSVTFVGQTSTTVVKLARKETLQFTCVQFSPAR